MFCGISGQVAGEPAVSVKSGTVFEKRLIEAYVAEHGKCPVTGEALTKEDILPVKGGQPVKPRSASASSIPGMLSIFQNEWDSLMLETHSLKQSLHTVRQELSHALYQHDAACRVIARLIKERDAAHEALAAAERNPAAATGAKRGAEEAAGGADKRAKGGITEDVIAQMLATSATLSKGRKKRPAPPGLATPEEVEKMELKGTHPLHKTTKSGITAVDLSPTNPDVTATAGVDGSVVVFNKGEGVVKATLGGHSSKVNAVTFLGSEGLLLSASNDKTARIWKGDGASYSCSHILSDHSAAVTAVSLHATGNYVVTASEDKTWCFYDIESGTCLKQVGLPDVTAGYSCAEFHPDGLILGTGTKDSLVRIWDVKSQENVAKFEGHSGAVQSINFSENGYYLATSASDGVKLWDLRKLKNFRSFSPYEKAGVQVARFDKSGQYLAVGGQDVRVYGVKQEWALLKEFSDVPKKGATDLRFGPDARTIVVSCLDRNLRHYGV